MKTDKNIFIAFILNLSFSIFELLGGLYTGSIAILTDSIHDFGDAISIGVSYFLEKKSKKKPNNKYTYGYLRYSVFGSIITTTILFVGSALVIFESIKRILNPVEINYTGMLILAIIGVIVNIIATYTTREGDSLNQKAVNLHMLEDVLGWVVVLIGSITSFLIDLVGYNNFLILNKFALSLSLMGIGFGFLKFINLISFTKFKLSTNR